jgi:type I restriction enzyme R subunit
MRSKGKYVPGPDRVEPLSAIIRELNDRFGTDFSDEDKVFIAQLEAKLSEDPALAASVHVNPPENVR